MLTRDGHVKLLDFGLATVEGEPEPDGGDAPSGGSSEPRPALGLAPTMPATPTPTTGGRIAGTPASMAPEQARGDAVDARADVYGFGVVLYEMLSGQAPFAHRGGKPWEWGDGSSPAWAPRRRLREVAPKVPRDIEDLVRRCTSYAKEQRPLDGAALVPLLEACARPRPRRWPFVAVGITVAALASSIAWAEWRRREHGEHPAAGAPLASTLPVAPKPTLRRVAYDEGVGAGSLSSDGTKMAYTTFFDAARPRPKTFRVRNLETRADEWFPVPGDAGVAWASFAGEGSAERLLVETAGPERALYVIRPDTKEATRVAPSLVPPSGATMSADGRFVLWLRYDAEQKTGQYMLREMATGVTRELGAVTELTTEFEISPTGALVGWLDHQGAAARLRVAHRDAPSQAKSIVLDPSLEYHAFTWIDDDRLALLTKDSLVSLRLDSSTLERRGSLEPNRPPLRAGGLWAEGAPGATGDQLGDERDALSRHGRAPRAVPPRRGRASALLVGQRRRARDVGVGRPHVALHFGPIRRGGNLRAGRRRRVPRATADSRPSRKRSPPARAGSRRRPLLEGGRRRPRVALACAFRRQDLRRRERPLRGARPRPSAGLEHADAVPRERAGVRRALARIHGRRRVVSPRPTRRNARAD